MPPVHRGRFTIVQFGFQNVVSLPDAGLLHRALRHLLRQGHNTVVVNMRLLKDVDRACVECLVSAARKLRRGGGRFILRHCPDELYDQLRLHGWDRLFLLPLRRVDDALSLPPELRELAFPDAGGEDPEP
jgi:anti-anti-sigma regulatory factor